MVGMASSHHRVAFTGDARTYFGIWIVNILLSIVTLGIYSAWAKVRSRRYFAQNTVIDGRRFDYHATGGQILIGRIIVLVGLLILQIPVVNLVALLALLFLFPWLMNRALAFDARMTSFSGVRFGFQGRYGRAFLVFMLYPLLAALTLFLAQPFSARARQRYVMNHRSYGTARFHFDSGVGAFYRALGLAVLWAVAVLVLGFLALGGWQLLGQLAMLDQGAPMEPRLIGRLVLLYFLVFAAMLPAAMIYRAVIRNTIFAGSELAGGHRFYSDVSPWQMLWIAISNAVVTALTLGLMLPWARVRMARYLADHSFVRPAGPLDDFIGAKQGQVGAIGDAYADFEGIDVGIGI